MKKFAILLLSLFVFACQSSTPEQATKPVNEIKTIEEPRAKFEPEDGKCILFVGQDLASIGGLDEYDEGYYDNFDAPGGFTMYTTFMPGSEEFGFTYKGLDGIFTTDNWGDNDSNMSMQLADEDFKNSVLAIGLKMVDHEVKIANGEHDSLIIRFGDWLKTLGKRPVFLRIGYEFGGSWNHYDREKYLEAYRRIKDKLDEMEVTNVAYVWQSHGWDEPMDYLESWYPGDDYVDWCSTSFFNRWDEINMIEFARSKGKPVFIAEATPTISGPTAKQDGKTKQTILSDNQQAEEAWNKWFIPFFKTIHDNPDVVKAVSYINCQWRANPMWFDNPTFQKVDARLQTSETIAKRWIQETSKDTYLKASEVLFDELWGE